ncbi:MAG: hypothetical protein D6706_05630, partial [Chloroflexi bacterium]
MSDPFQPVEQFDAIAFANALLKHAQQRREQYKTNSEADKAMLWNREPDQFGDWTVERVQQVLDALGPRGPLLFAGSFLQVFVNVVGELSKQDPNVLIQAQQHCMQFLKPFIDSGQVDVSAISAPLSYT